MGVFYGMVARGQVVLAEFSAIESNASVIAKQILDKTNQGNNNNNNDSSASYSHDRYVFHVKRTDGLTTICMANDALGRRIPFAFLEEIHNRFVRTYGRAILTAPAYAMNDEFSRVLSQQIDYYSTDPNADRLNRLKGEMTQVRTVMIDNIEKVLERGNRLEVLIEKTTAMNGNSIRFKSQSRRFQNNMWWRNVRLMSTLIIIFILITYITLAFICHGPLLTSCWRDNKP